MSDDNLFELFDLESRVSSLDTSWEDPAVLETPVELEAVPYALEVDSWAIRKGEEAHSFNRTAFDKLKSSREEAVDFFALAYEMDPKPADAPCVEPGRKEFVLQLMEQPEYKALHRRTLLDVMASDLAALSFAEQFSKLKGNGPGSSKKPPGGSSPEDKPEPGKQSGKPSEGTSEPGKGTPDMESMKAAARALKNASEQIDAADDMAQSMGMTPSGMGPGTPGGSYDPKRVADLFKKVRGRGDLRRIFELAGRFRRLARSLQRQKTTHGMDDTVGVRPDGNLALALPQELSLLGEELLELDLLRRLTERQLMCREHIAPEPVARGPIIVTVDESGSMYGEKVYQAKALALTMAWLAKQQRRWCALVSYSGDTGERLLPLAPNQWSDSKIMDWLEQFIGGGSWRDVPVVEMPGYYETLKAPKGKTDVIFITDAICRLDKKQKAKFQDWKQSVKAKVITLLIGEDSNKNPLMDVSDEMYQVPSLELNSQPVQRVLSI